MYLFMCEVSVGKSSQRLKLIGLDEALIRIDEAFKDYSLSVETVSLEDSRGRILAENIISSMDVPDYRRSTVDGFALASVGCYLNQTFNVIGQVEMGSHTAIKIGLGEAVYVPTGGMVPDGADVVIMKEDVTIEKSAIQLNKVVTTQENVIEIGDDITKGSTILKAGKLIRAQEIGALVSVGMQCVQVFKKPRMSILCTGDELINLMKRAPKVRFEILTQRH